MKNIKNEIIPDFLLIPYQVYGDSKLTPVDKFVYGVIYFYSNMSSGKCMASNKTIGAPIKVASSSVANSLVRLEEGKYIVREFIDSETHVRRKGITPLVRMSHLLKNKSRSYLVEEAKSKKTSSLVEEHTYSDKEHTYLSKEHISDTPTDTKKPLKTKVKLDVLPDSSYSTKEEIKSNRGRVIKNTNTYLISDPSGQTKNGDGEDNRTIKNGDIKEPSAGSIINDAIALFLPILSGDFIGSKSAFAKPATREAVAALLKKYSIPEIKELIRKYDAGKTDPYRPQIGTVYEFCTTKLGKVEAFVSKSAGGLWAQKSISTPEQRADSDSLIKIKIEAGREKIRKAKEEWALTHPEEK